MMTIDMTYKVNWGAMQGENLVKYVRLISVEQGWIFVQPIDEFGTNLKFGAEPSESRWLSPAAVQSLTPFIPKENQKGRRR